MIEFTFEMAQRAFVNQQAIQRAVDRGERRATIRSLAFIRIVAKRSLRRRKSVSRPGMPPSVHSRSSVASLKAIFFVYDSMKHGGVVGPIKLNVRGSAQGDKATPGVLEHGGTVTYRRKSRGRKRRKVRVAPRPFMKPALDVAVEQNVIASAWEGVVTG